MIYFEPDAAETAFLGDERGLIARTIVQIVGYYQPILAAAS